MLQAILFIASLALSFVSYLLTPAKKSSNATPDYESLMPNGQGVIHQEGLASALD